jgi:hypothetical protein
MPEEMSRQALGAVFLGSCFSICDFEIDYVQIEP